MSGIKDWVRSSFEGELLISKFHELEGFILPRVVSDETAVKKYYKNHTGKKLDLQNPITFSEKMNWYKLYGKLPLMVQCADKVAMRDYVADNGFGHCLNEIYGVYTNVKDIDISKLPTKFVIKAAHGTHMQIIVKDKNKINWKRETKMMKSWLRQDIYWRGREWVYKDIPHRIIVEKYLEDEFGELRDYKVFCFNGIPRFVQVDAGRYQNVHVRNYYDLDWKFLAISDDVRSDPDVVMKKPDSYAQMIAIAKQLSKPFQFVRVDFYEVAGKPYVGELTFFHNGGMARMEPDSWEKKIGDYWILVK
jgi:hypothetical protein